MLAVYDKMRRMAPSRAPVFITGESGTGKELAAEAIHHCAATGERPFVAINCSAIPHDLMESEIFGHVRGAFTGATENRTGAAEQAHGGTLFLDEIAEMDLGLQAKLLRFVQSGTLQRVGDSQMKRVKVRIVCATNRDPCRGRGRAVPRRSLLPAACAADPPGTAARAAGRHAAARRSISGSLRKRGKAGLPPLLRCAVERLRACDWPGNVRELANTIRRIVVLNDAEEVTVDMLPAGLAAGAREASREAPGMDQPVPTPLWREEQRIIEAALNAYGGNIARAAAMLEISPSTIYRKRQAWEERARLPG